MQEAFAVWSKPGESDFHIIRNEEKSDSNTRFIFAPFDVSNETIAITGQPSGVFAEDLKIPNLALEMLQVKSTSREDYESWVHQVTGLISSTILDKVVLSTLTTLEAPQNLSEFVKHLRASHPSAFIYFVYHSHCGAWMGATPEPLLTSEGEQYLTVSLAGTRVHEQGIHPWGQKESLEQSIVTDYIRERLNEAGAMNLRIGRPETIRYGSLEHLRSDIRFTSDAPETVVQALHPTPAVCGTPFNDALATIKSIEKHDRKFYTGYVGIIEPNHETALYVNLRCMEVFADGLSAYTGGGITFESDPIDEWYETREKLKALLNNYLTLPA